MFWLDGSSKLPFPIVSTRFIGKPCVEHLAEDLASIENQAKIAKSWVEIGDFDRWCHAASELVDLTYYLIYADTTFLYYEELISADERLRRCSQLKSQLVDSVRFSTFELARTRLVANLPLHQRLPLSPLYPFAVTNQLSSAHRRIAPKRAPE